MRKLEENVKFERYCGKYRNGMKRVDVWWTSWESAVIGDFGGVLIILEISVDFQGVM